MFRIIFKTAKPFEQDTIMYCLHCNKNQAIKGGLLCEKCRNIADELLAEDDKQERQLADENKVFNHERSECGTHLPTQKN